jgi:hypothetical protein
MTFLDLAEKILREVKRPMTVSQIWEYAQQKDYTSQLDSQGKTPANTLGAQLHVNAKDKKNSPFASVGSGPKRFYLKSLKYDKSLLVEEVVEPNNGNSDKSAFLEKDLHPLLAYFNYYFQGAFSKTLDHTKSTKKQFGEWVHPDMVACGFVLDEWKSEVYDLSLSIGQAPIHLVSFEIKKSLTFGNLRESFFQAVSNSSWAHQGFLVTASISKEKEFLDELLRLSNSFGIGVILLDMKDPDDSEIIFEAEEKEILDWEVINKLTINPDFSDFLKRIQRDIESKEIRKEWYDKIEKKETLVRRFKK